MKWPCRSFVNDNTHCALPVLWGRQLHCFNNLIAYNHFLLEPHRLPFSKSSEKRDAALDIHIWCSAGGELRVTDHCQPCPQILYTDLLKIDCSTRVLYCHEAIRRCTSHLRFSRSLSLSCSTCSSSPSVPLEATGTLLQWKKNQQLQC